MGGPGQAVGPAVPAIDDTAEAPPYPGVEPTMEGWGEPDTRSWYGDTPEDQRAWGASPEYQGGHQADYQAAPHDTGPIPFDTPAYEAPAYGAPEYPGQSRERRGRTGLLVGLAVLVVILLVVVGVLVVSDGDGDNTAGADGSSSPVATSSESSSASASPSASASTPEAQAKAVDDLLSRAAGGKSLLTTAYDQATNCEISPASAEKKFEDAAKNRRDIVASARELDTDKLENGARIKSLMISMYDTSAKADDAFAAWARAGAAKGESCLKGNAKRTKGNNLSIKAGKTKKKFVKVWNPVAEQYGHAKRTKDGL